MGSASGGTGTPGRCGGVDARLAALVRRVHPEGVLQASVPLAGGISATVTKLWVNVVDRDVNLVLRQPDAATFEFRLLTLLHGRGLPVPRPLWLEPPGPLLASGGLLLSWLPGRSDLTGRAIKAGVAEAARLLARIHRLDGQHPDFDFLPDGPADALSPSRGNDRAVLHGDYWPGNWLWHDGQLHGVLDWEDAHRGDPLEDLANARLEVFMRFGADAVAAFTVAYRGAAPAVDTGRLGTYDRWAADRAAGRVVRWTEDSVERDRMTAAIRAFSQATRPSPPE